VVVAPHPDDEVFGAGGLMHDLARAGWSLTVVAVTDGEGAFGPTDDPGALAVQRRHEQAIAWRLLDLGDVAIHRLDVPDGQVDRYEAEVAAALAPIADGASWLITTWRHDGHPDHDATGRAVAGLAGDVGIAIAEFPIWGEDRLPWQGRWRWPLTTATRAAKAAAMDAFASQLEPSPYGEPVVPAALIDRWRGADEVLLA
jgi:LmbE family N-acetylglucosaminyl deacetylase